MTTPQPAGHGAVSPFTPEQARRYSRQISLPEIGEEGQRKLLEARVLVVGAGGLGSPIALYLAAAGVGTLGLVDFDTVDLSNLQRQVLHHVHDLGRPKVQSAMETIAEINPEVKVEPHPVMIDAENVLDIVSRYDLSIIACDNFRTRYLVNHAAVALRKPLVEGGIWRFEGQVTVFLPGQGCYSCLYPSAPPPSPGVPAGPVGVLPGIIGCIQAAEAIKLILSVGDPLVGRLLLFDMLTMDFREVRIRRDPACPVCGDGPKRKQLADYVEG